MNLLAISTAVELLQFLFTGPTELRDSYDVVKGVVDKARDLGESHVSVPDLHIQAAKAAGWHMPAAPPAEVAAGESNT